MPEAKTITDAKGRKITLRPGPDVMLSMDILEAAGLDQRGNPTSRFVTNDRWMGYATLACYVSDIDGIPVPMPTHSAQIRALVGQLGNEGIAAISEAINTTLDTGNVNLEAAKN